MPTLTAELILTLDGLARGTRSPAFYGYAGPEFDAWLAEEDGRPHHQILGRRTFEMLDDLPDEARDDAWRRMAERPGLLFSTTLTACRWPGLRVVRDDPVATLRALKAGDGPDLKTAGSLSVVRQLAAAGLVDVLRLVLCPLVLPRTGIEPAFAGWPDAAFDLASTRVLDGRVLVLDLRPAGPPPAA